METLSDLIQFLRDRYDDAERVAQATIHPGRTGEWTFVEYEEDGQRRWELTFDEIAPDLDDTLLMGPSTMRHIALHDPARVLREVEANRRILGEHPHVPAAPWGSDKATAVGCETCHDRSSEGVIGIGWCATVRALGTVHESHPGYRDEWKP